MQILFESDNKPFHEHPDSYFYLWIPWQNHRFCQEQLLSQNYSCSFPQQWEIGSFITCLVCVTLDYRLALLHMQIHQPTLSAAKDKLHNCFL